MSALILKEIFLCAGMLGYHFIDCFNLVKCMSSLLFGLSLTIAWDSRIDFSRFNGWKKHFYACLKSEILSFYYL